MKYLILLIFLLPLTTNARACKGIWVDDHFRYTGVSIIGRCSCDTCHLYKIDGTVDFRKVRKVKDKK